MTYMLLGLVFFEGGAFEGAEFQCNDDHTDDHSDDHTDDHADDHSRIRQLSSSENEVACVSVDLGAVLYGWGVPTATDISLAWMVAILVFGYGHRAIGFLLLLAVVDDGIGRCVYRLSVFGGGGGRWGCENADLNPSKAHSTNPGVNYTPKP